MLAFYVIGGTTALASAAVRICFILVCARAAKRTGDLTALGYARVVFLRSRTWDRASDSNRDEESRRRDSTASPSSRDRYRAGATTARRQLQLVRTDCV